MKIGNAVIVFENMPQNRQRMVFLTVKSTVCKFNLRYFLFEKEIQLPTDTFDREEVHGFVDGRKTIAAGEGTASAAFIIDDTICKVCQVFFPLDIIVCIVCSGIFGIAGVSGCCIPGFISAIPEGNFIKRKPDRIGLIENRGQTVGCSIYIRRYQIRERTFPGTCHNAAQLPSVDHFLCVVGDLGPAGPEIGLWQYFVQVGNNGIQYSPIPDITGEGGHFGLLFINFL